ncbi:hypothetical protein [Campylobacter sp. CCS1377]|uniref:Uncharacterized protein n=1 Tax=Campylobacter sp. CCS1377 TaxID=3158229 RepID=A0AAU7E6Z3_9BACT
MDNSKLENRKIIDVCDLFVTFKNNIESLFSLIQIDSASPKIERLPTFNIPQEIKDLEPNLRHQPTYRLKFENIDTNIFLGDNIIGFDLFKKDNSFIFKVLESIGNEIESISRIGTKRVFNVDSIKDFLTIKIKDKDCLDFLSNIKLREEHDDNVCFVTIINKTFNKTFDKITLDKEKQGYIMEIIAACEKISSSGYDDSICEKINELYKLQDNKMDEMNL